MIEIEKTPYRRATEERHAEIRQMVAQLREKYPDAATSRIYAAVAQAYGLTRPGVASIMKKYGDHEKAEKQ